MTESNERNAAALAICRKRRRGRIMALPPQFGRGAVGWAKALALLFIPVERSCPPTDSMQTAQACGGHGARLACGRGRSSASAFAHPTARRVAFPPPGRLGSRDVACPGENAK